MIGNVRVVELAEGVAGPLAALRLGDLGASVVKVEGPDGDWMRGAEPRLPESPVGAAYFALNRGKRALALGDNPAAAAPVLRGLIQQADVLITDRSEAELAALGLPELAEDPCPLNGRLIVANLSAFGARGPLAEAHGSELVAQAFAGYTRWLGAPGQPPRRLGADVAGTTTAIFTAQAVLAALLHRGRTGRGQRVALSLANSLLTMKTVHLAAQSDPDTYEGPRVGGPAYPPEHGWKTADRPITFSFGGSVGAEGRPGWVQFVEALGLNQLLDDPRFDKTGRNSTGLGPQATELRPEYERRFRDFPADHVVDKAREFKGTGAVFQRHEEVLSHPQTQALELVRTLPDGAGGERRVLAFPGRFSRSRPELRGGIAALGQHSREVAAEAGLPAERIEEIFRLHGLSEPGAGPIGKDH